MHALTILALLASSAVARVFNRQTAFTPTSGNWTSGTIVWTSQGQPACELTFATDSKNLTDTIDCQSTQPGSPYFQCHQSPTCDCRALSNGTMTAQAALSGCSNTCRAPGCVSNANTTGCTFGQTTCIFGSKAH